jgi:hypothetical protein
MAVVYTTNMDVSMDFKIKDVSFDLYDLSGDGSKYFFTVNGKYSDKGTDFSVNYWPHTYSPYKIETIKRETAALQDSSFVYTSDVSDISFTMMVVPGGGNGTTRDCSKFNVRQADKSVQLHSGINNGISYELKNFIFYNLFDTTGQWYQKAAHTATASEKIYGYWYEKMGFGNLRPLSQAVGPIGINGMGNFNSTAAGSFSDGLWVRYFGEGGNGLKWVNYASALCCLQGYGHVQDATISQRCRVSGFRQTPDNPTRENRTATSSDVTMFFELEYREPFMPKYFAYTATGQTSKSRTMTVSAYSSNEYIPANMIMTQSADMVGPAGSQPVNPNTSTNYYTEITDRKQTKYWKLEVNSCEQGRFISMFLVRNTGTWSENDQKFNP